MNDKRGTCWSITINNPVASDEEAIALARQRGWNVDGQLEKGESGTPHYQLIVKTPQVRFSAIKKAFPRAHIELARNKEALENYVHKEDTREAELTQQNEFFPSLQRVWDMWADWVDNNVDYDWTRIDSDRLLELFDGFVAEYIIKGYVLEGIAVNPQTRASVKRFGWMILHRSFNRRQINKSPSNMSVDTDRQTDEIIVPTYNINS